MDEDQKKDAQIMKKYSIIKKISIWICMVRQEQYRITASVYQVV